VVYPAWPTLDYILDQDNRDLFMEHQLVAYLDQIPTAQIKALVTACCNASGETLLERAVFRNRAALAGKILEVGQRDAVLALGTNAFNVFTAPDVLTRGICPAFRLRGSVLLIMTQIVCYRFC
jgi:hypothetical protein